MLCAGSPTTNSVRPSPGCQPGGQRGQQAQLQREVSLELVDQQRRRP